MIIPDNLCFDLTHMDKVVLDNFYPLLFDKSRYLLMRGGWGSGKSIFAIQKILIRILIGYKTNTKHNILVIMKTFNSHRNITFKEIKEWIYTWGLQDICTPTSSPMEINFSNGSRIFFLGCDKPEKLLSLSRVTSIWIEEATRVTKNDFEIIDSRLRGVRKTYPQIMMTFNPVSKLNWLYDYFYTDEAPEDTTLHLSLPKDNYFLRDKKYMDMLKKFKETNINKYNTYYLGKWGLLEGTIYENFEYIDELPKIEFEDVVYGLDFGDNNPSALIKISIYDDDYYLEELLYKSKLTPPRLVDEIKKVISKEERQVRYIYADTNRPDLIRLLNYEGFNVFKADKKVEAGRSFVQGKKLYILKSSKNLKKEIEGYVYMVDKNGKSLEVPLKDNDHLMDAMRYGIYTYHKKKLLRPGFIEY